jgi:signal transduction histidine kinase/DNA-binding response OmpR family regulator
MGLLARAEAPALRMLETLSIRSRMLLLSGMLIAGMLGVTAYLTTTMSSNAKLVALNAQRAQEIALADDIHHDFAEYRYWLSDLAVSLLRQSETKATEARHRLDAGLKKLEGSQPELATLLQHEVSGFEVAGLMAVDAYTDDKRVIGNTFFAEARQHGMVFEEKLSVLVDELLAQAQSTREQVLQRTQQSTRLATLIVALAVLLGMLATWVVLRSILMPLNRVVTAIDGLTAGHIDTPIPAASRDEIGAMAKTLALFREGIIDRNRQRDLLERRQHELEAAMAQAEAANLAKSSFLANMSHELRTPLNAIIGYSEILQEMSQDDGLDEYTGDLGKIQSAGRHLLNLISDILDLSKIEAGKMDIYFEDFELPALVEEIRAIVKPLIEKNSNVLEIVCPPDIGKMHSDRTKLKQNLLNLISNATKFTTNGTVSLTIERDRAQANEPVTFRVRDSGIGMTPEQLAKLFAPFAQADASTTKRYGGTGLGLAITRHFCEILGGSIQVDSTAGVGSVFTMVLPGSKPAVPGDAGAAAMPASDPGAGNAPLVMVVDDDPASRHFLAMVLHKEGWRVVEAEGGEAAIALARKLRPAAITLDIMMPRMDGWSVLTALKSDAELSDIPVVVVTCTSDRGLALSLGASDFMTKPVDRSRLGLVLNKLLDEVATVLVVDDDAMSRELTKAHIQQLNVEVFEAQNGCEALGWLAANPLPSLILLDLMMPEMDGFMVLEKLAAHALWRDIPVVVITAKDLSAQEREWLGKHAHSVIAKGSANAKGVAAEVRQALRERTPLEFMI